MAANEAQAVRSIFDLNEYLLDKVLDHLSLADLGDLHETCTHLQVMAANRFQKVYQNKLRLGFHGSELDRPDAYQIISDANGILHAFGRYIEALSVETSLAFGRLQIFEMSLVSEQLLNVIEAGLFRGERAPLHYLKFSKFYFDDAGIVPAQEVLQMTRRLSLHQCEGRIWTILPQCAQMTHFEFVDRVDIREREHQLGFILNALPPFLEGLSIINGLEVTTNFASVRNFFYNFPMLRLLRLIDVYSEWQFQELIPSIVTLLRNLELLSLRTAEAVDLRQLIDLPCLRHLEINHASCNLPLIEHYIIHKQLKSLGLEDVDDGVISTVAQIEYLPMLKLTKCKASTVLSIVVNLMNLRELYLFKCDVDIGDILMVVGEAQRLKKLVVNRFDTEGTIEYSKWKHLDRKCSDRPNTLRIDIYICEKYVDEAKLLECNYKHIHFHSEASNELCENDCFSIRTHISGQSDTVLSDPKKSVPVRLSPVPFDEDNEMGVCFESDDDEGFPENAADDDPNLK